MFLFILKILFLLAVASARKSVQDEELPELQWSKQYSFEATKLSLTSGLVEDISYWRTTRKSRVDYNKGAKKTISVKRKKKSYGVQYEIHPETTEEYTNKFICLKTKGSMSEPIELIDILPSTSDFVHAGKDIFEMGEVEKFQYIDEDLNEKTKKYIWVFLDRNSSSWIPVKLEEFEYNSWLGNLKKRSQWIIFNYKSEVSSSVFDVDQYNCTDSEDFENTLIDINDKTHVDRVFTKFQEKHARKYKDESEHELRRKIFEKNLRLIQEHNNKDSTFTLGINKLADQTPEEMRRRKGLQRRKEGESGNVPFPYTKSKLLKISQTLPKEFDLRLLGVISPVKDQEDCGCCWTMGTTSAVEGALARNNGGRLLRLANQALIDCAWGFGVSGCNGGSDTGAYHWMMKYGLPTEEEYGPYNNKDGFCRIQNMTKTYPIKGFTDVTPFSTEALKVALINHGPLSVSIDATDMLIAYTSGIFYDPNCNPSALNHEVTLVGYGEYEGDTYWIVKNSWGRSWGIDGYFHISTRDNSCGITTEPTYVVF
ncbi:digestive cysteine proteinase 2-like [Nymphalis io]|uniref:digestive cysteine proteinase 2-like n=1 Tax=Inachis io TaxID=171585 RepID=UPI002169AD22|nr:digestive cysteine proteinase 2-like [Nymphalis io]